MCRSAALGLQSLTSYGIVHCDVSSRNYLLDLSQRPMILKVADLGRAVQLGPSEQHKIGEHNLSHLTIQLMHMVLIFPYISEDSHFTVCVSK